MNVFKILRLLTVLPGIGMFGAFLFWSTVEEPDIIIEIFTISLIVWLFILPIFFSFEAGYKHFYNSWIYAILIYVWIGILYGLLFQAIALQLGLPNILVAIMEINSVLLRLIISTPLIITIGWAIAKSVKVWGKRLSPIS